MKPYEILENIMKLIKHYEILKNIMKSYEILKKMSYL